MPDLVDPYPGVPYVEAQAILAAQEIRDGRPDAEDILRGILGGMLPHELRHLADACRILGDRARRAADALKSVTDAYAIGDRRA